MIGTAIWNIFRNVNEQNFEEMKVFGLFEVSEFLHKFF